MDNTRDTDLIKKNILEYLSTHFDEIYEQIIDMNGLEEDEVQSRVDECMYLYSATK